MGGVGELRPRQHHVTPRRDLRLDLRAPGTHAYRQAEAVAAGEAAEDLRRRPAEVAVSRRVLGERRGRERRGLVGQPLASVDDEGATAGAAPRPHLLAAELV